MKIVHITVKPGCVRTRRAARVQRNQGHEVVLVMGSKIDPDSDGLLPAGEVDGFPAFALNEAKPAWFRECVMDLKPDLVFAHELQVLFHLIAIWTREVNDRLDDGDSAQDAGFEFSPFSVPLIYDSHEFETGRPYEWKKDTTDREIAWKERLCIQCVDHVVTPSFAIAARLKDMYALKNYPTVIFNSPFAPVRKFIDRNAMRESLGIRAGEKAIAFAGYLTPDRMIHQLVRAFVRLGKEWRLYILGKRGEVLRDGKIERPPIEQEIETYGGIHLGEIPYPWPESQRDGLTMFDVLGAMDVCFSGSDVRNYWNWRLGLPNKFFEYAMSGTPQILSNAEDPAGWISTCEAEGEGIGVIYKNSVSDLVVKIGQAEGVRVNAESMALRFAYDRTQATRLNEALVIAMIRFSERAGTHRSLRS